jgi:transposase
MTIEGRMNGERFVEFLKRLIYKRTKPVFLVLDGHPVHKSKQVTDFVESTDGRLRLFILPPYSPHLNPDEWVWNWLKNHKLGRKSVSGPDHFRSVVKRYLSQLSKLKHVVRGFFLDKNLDYI